MAQRGQTFGGEFQIRQDAGSPSPGTITGAVIVYGDTAPNPYGGLGPERMLTGAWGPDVDRQPWTATLCTTAVNRLGQPATGLTVQDSDAALTAELVLPDSELGRETAYLARNGKVSGLSGEFDILQQYVAADGVRNVVRVAGDAIGLVDNPGIPAIDPEYPTERQPECFADWPCRRRKKPSGGGADCRPATFRCPGFSIAVRGAVAAGTRIGWPIPAPSGRTRIHHLA